MGPRTSRQFNRVASQMLRYVKSSQDYDEFGPADDHWYKHEARGAVRNNPGKLRATRLPKFQPVQIPMLPPLDREQRLPRKAVR